MLGSSSAKQRIIISILVGGVFLVLAMFVLTILRNAGKESFDNDSKIIRLQYQIIQASDSAAHSSGNLETRTLASTLSIAVLNDNKALVDYVNKNAPKNFLKNVPTTDKDIEAKLKKATADNDFDKGYLSLVNDLLSDYVKDINASKQASPSKVKTKILDDSLAHVAELEK